MKPDVLGLTDEFVAFIEPFEFVALSAEAAFSAGADSKLIPGPWYNATYRSGGDR